jgi:hypothetical protein
MTPTTWLLTIGAAVFLILTVFLIVRGYGPAMQNFLATIWNSPVGRHIILILTLVITLQIIESYTRYVADDKAGDWLTQYNGKVTTAAVGTIDADIQTVFDPASTPTPAAPSPSPLPSPSPSASASPQVAQAVTATNITPTENASSVTTAAATPTPSPTPTDTENARLKAQLQIIRDRGKHHGNVMAYFYVNYFVAIVMVMTAGLLVAVTLFFIAQQGWTGTNSYVRTIFVVASAYMAFYGLFSPVFQEQKNITDNKELFLRYKSLENEVDSYPITLLTLKGDPKVPREFINHIDDELDRLGNIALGFDISKVSYDQAFEPSSPRPTPTPAVTAPGGQTPAQKPR